MRTFALFNIKGGVGKTASAVNLAWLSAAAGARTLLWDLDPQGAATFYFRIRPRIKGGMRRLLRRRRGLDSLVRETDHEGLDLLPADFSFRQADLVLGRAGDGVERLARLIEPLRHEYDHVYLDCAPSISLVTEAVLRAADTLLVPTIPTTLSLRTLRQLCEHLHDHARPPQTLAFFTLVDRRKAMHREILAGREQLGVRLLSSEIPYSSVVERMGQRLEPLALFAPKSEAAQAYDRLWREILDARSSRLGRDAHGQDGEAAGGAGQPS